MIPCARPDCTGDGVIDEEGLCSECGLPPVFTTTGRASAEAGTPVLGGPALRASTESALAADRPASDAFPVWAATPWAGTEVSRAAGPDASPAVRARPGRTSSTSLRGRLGAGLVAVPPMPRRDPEAAILTAPQVPESQRWCGNPQCRAAVGRSWDSLPGRARGFCRLCRTPFAFEPALGAGDLVGQYEVRGPIAHGGQGWIYLARDRNLDGDPVVLKGLLNTGDPESYAAFVAERRFLIEVKHPAIVQIRNFVQHSGRGAEPAGGYIVMEYVDGRSLRQVLREHHDGGAAGLPVARAVAYCLEILSAFGYLYDNGLLFCDLKPDNVMLVEDRLKLIDLGAVRRIGDEASDVWASPGYAAPEIEKGERHPAVDTDLYTVGRTLAVLTVPGAGVRLPDPGQSAVLSKYESFYRFLRRATHPDPASRFDSADEMSEQLIGVLRQVLAIDGQAATPAPSARLTPERAVVGTDLHAPPEPRALAEALPTPRDDGADPDGPGPDPDGIAHGSTAPPPRAGSKDPNASSDLSAVPAVGDWRVLWQRALSDLAANRISDATQDFLSVLEDFPGELAPQLALAACAELGGHVQLARHYYTAVWRTDPGYMSAGFGIARTLLADPALNPGDRRTEAIAVLESVPGSRHHHVAAWTEALRLRLDPAGLTGARLTAAAERLRLIPLGGVTRTRLRAELLAGACDWLDGGGADSAVSVGSLDGVPMTRKALRQALADCYLILSRHTQDRRERELLVDRAHLVRPMTMI
jgi:serine/threonine-protein kinase PknG